MWCAAAPVGLHSDSTNAEASRAHPPTRAERPREEQQLFRQRGRHRHGWLRRLRWHILWCAPAGCRTAHAAARTRLLLLAARRGPVRGRSAPAPRTLRCTAHGKCAPAECSRACCRCLRRGQQRCAVESHHPRVHREYRCVWRHAPLASASARVASLLRSCARGRDQGMTTAS